MGPCMPNHAQAYQNFSGDDFGEYTKGIQLLKKAINVFITEAPII